jgi:putative nucleotidyltransferase with HDIG domain
MLHIQHSDGIKIPGIKMKPKRKRPATVESLVAKARYSELASIGSVVNKLLEIIRNPSSSAMQLKGIIEVDPPLSAKILRRANSAYYGVKRNVTSIQEAIVFIGFNTVKELALNLKVGTIFSKSKQVHNYSRQKLWKHSLAVAMCCKNIYRREFREQGEDIYSSALLHDIGIMVEEEFAPDDFTQIAESMEQSGEAIQDIEKGLLGFDHPLLAQKLIEAWNMPEELAKTIAYHHRPKAVDPQFIKPAMTIFVSDYITKKNNLGIGEGDEGLPPETEFMDCLDALKISSDSIEIIIEDVVEEIENLERNGELYA